VAYRPPGSALRKRIYHDRRRLGSPKPPRAPPPPTTAQQRYTAVAIALHWAIALMIVGLIAVGWIMEAMPGGPGSPKTAIIQLHKSFGITVLLLTIVRIVWRLMNPPPPEPAMPALQKFAASAVHVLLYVLMIAMPLTGWIMASAEIGLHETRYFGTFEMYVPGIPGLPEDTRKPLAEGFEQVHGNLPGSSSRFWRSTLLARSNISSSTRII